MSEWQDISTAPKDETVVLLYQQGKSSIGPHIGWYQGGKYPWAFIDSKGPAECPDCQYEIAVFIEPNGFLDEYPPTHWMPLPDPPKDAST